MRQELLHTLQQYWGYTSFRPLQYQIIEAAIAGRDVFAILPTGGGKSLCYQLPAVMLPGTTLVISPLISLMEDQVYNLNDKGIHATCLHSGMGPGEIQDVLEQARDAHYKLLYCAPERLHSDMFQRYAEQIQWSMMVVDEAHCISQWGHDFRPLYRHILQFADSFKLRNKMALTASATTVVQADILQQLQLRDAAIFKQSVVRENLHYHIHVTEHKLQPLLSSIQHKNSIVYCPTRKLTESIATQLNAVHKSAAPYHAGLSKEQRSHIQQQWVQQDNLIICATNAFGMGIDKPNVREVIHWAPPYSLEAYYQEAGRAGRDGKSAHATLFITPRDIADIQESIEHRFPPLHFIFNVYVDIANYLKIGIGEGADQQYFFSLEAFNKQYQHPVMPLLHAIKLIESEGYWIWQHDDKTQHKVHFTASQADIEQLQQVSPPLYELAIQLLRIYGDIYHYTSKVDITTIAKISQLSYEQVQTGLYQLNKFGIIHYQPAMEGNSLFWLENRLSKQQFQWNHKRVARLKEAYVQRINAMVAYIQDQHSCRNQLLASYFGEDKVPDCGRCDNCLRKKQSKSSHNLLKHEIHAFIKINSPSNLKVITLAFPDDDIHTVLDHIQQLSLEGHVKIQGTNVIFVP